jgi:hypothetical protein
MMKAAYRSLTLSWFTHSPLLEALDKLAEKEIDIMITTDHGTIRVQEPSKVIAERATNTTCGTSTGVRLLLFLKMSLWSATGRSHASDTICK